MTKMCIPKHVRVGLGKRRLRAGWRVGPSNRQHVIIQAPWGAEFRASLTPSNRDTCARIIDRTATKLEKDHGQ